MPLPLAPKSKRPALKPPSGETRSKVACHARTRGATTVVGGILGITLVAIAVWGIWVAADVARHYGADIVGQQQDKLSGMIFLLSWLVLFGPFLYFGAALLRSSFAPEERSWLIPLRVFTYVVGLRFLAEKQRRDFFENSAVRPLPPSASQEYLDMPAATAPGDKSPKEHPE
jgi:hypothetical protein